ncbi:GNAT family acetyltransferase [Histoplasma capsulatum var. duboisii H88]|uniref:GNAT family acetyltransferase n=2 Tax=Ajellomyces capsulatus TaxID=5037 RepID=F0UPL5_AJEC8|nr:GNAT family acetyltransferase [Histoplasma capsulatum H143]EGC47814.1 GNAT family acetyltransferase [Histoplasma capsulatum var. duboisii H88]
MAHETIKEPLAFRALKVQNLSPPWKQASNKDALNYCHYFIMSLTLSNAEECDVGDIADIHLASFGENMMLQAQFPTPALRAGLRISLMEKAREEIRDPQWAVLVVRNQNEIISFAKWMRPVLDADSYVEVPWRWPEGTRMDILNEWARKVEDASSSVIGSTPCYSQREGECSDTAREHHSCMAVVQKARV